MSGHLDAGDRVRGGCAEPGSNPSLTPQSRLVSREWGRQRHPNSKFVWSVPTRLGICVPGVTRPFVCSRRAVAGAGVWVGGPSWGWVRRWVLGVRARLTSHFIWCPLFCFLPALCLILWSAGDRHTVSLVLRFKWADISKALKMRSINSGCCY